MDIYYANGVGDIDDILLINNGNGYFADETDTRLPELPYTSSSRDVDFCDFDMDGDLDIFLACTGDLQNRLLINEDVSPDTISPWIWNTTVYPNTSDTTSPYVIHATIWDNLLQIDSAFVYVQFNFSGEFFPLTMKPVGGHLHRGEIPGNSWGSKVNYYLEAVDKMGNKKCDPVNAPDSVYHFQIDSSVVSIIDGIQDTKLPYTFVLYPNYPNPFNQSTAIRYRLSRDVEYVKLDIYDISGREVIRLVEGFQKAGQYHIIWNGRNRNGEEVPSGVYFYQFSIKPILTETKKMVLIW